MEDNAAAAPSTAVPELVLDDKSQKGFIAWYKSLPQEPQHIRFFDRKGFYSVHGEDALFIARTFYKTTAVVKYLGGAGEAGLAGVTLNRGLFETVLRELLLESADHSVEVYEGAGANWKVARSASPGKLTAFEEELFRAGDAADVPTVIAVHLSYPEGGRVVGVAYVDTAGRRLGACEFADDDNFCGLESVVVQLGAKEAVVVKADAGAGASGFKSQEAADARRLVDVLSRCGALASGRARSFFSAKHLESDLSKLVKSGSAEHHSDVLERRVAAGALAAVIAFTELLADSANHHKFACSLYDARQYMRLDAAAQRALNVFPTRTDANTNFSLYGLMCRARTPMGKRKLKVWLKQPLVQQADINCRLDVVEALVGDAVLRERLRDTHLRGMPDVERLCRRLEARRVGLPELCQLYRASAKLPLIEDALRCHEGPHAQMLCERYADALAEAHDAEHLSKFEELIEAGVDLDRLPHEYLIAPTYDPRLERLRADKERYEGEVTACASDAARDLGLQLDKTIKLEWHKASNSRIRCLRITQKEEKAVRSKLNARYKLIETRKDGTKFTSRALEAAAEKLQAASGQYEELQRELVEQVVEVAHTFVEVWESVAALLSELDVLAGFADLAVHAPAAYTRPEVLDSQEGELQLVGCRHPCVEAQDGVEFIPNDVHMARGSSWFQIITGPNMGGKSTFIRQVGVAVLMAQVGCFVPAETARIAVRDAIFARVGAGDCQQRGVSTFMAEMLETAAILKGATPQSLVIIDELGRGTSTYDGFGLAWAISEHLMEVTGAPTLFATHFHELTEITGPTGVKNLHVSTVVDPASGKLTMLYRIKEGACDQSFGIQVAESANFPSSVVSLAKQKLAELEGTEVAGLKAAGAKRKREQDEGQEQAAQQRARTFLSQVSSMPLLQQQQGSAGAVAVDAAALSHAQELLRELEADAMRNSALARMLAVA